MNCNCLCICNHPKLTGICTADAETTIPFDSSETGPVDVSMCTPCANATREEKQREVS